MFNLNTKLIMTSVLLGVIPAALLAFFIGWIAIDSGQATLEKQAIEKLIALRDAKKSEIEAYFTGLHNQIETFSNDRMIIDAMREFRSAYDSYRKETNNFGMASQRQALHAYYTDQFLSRYKTRNTASDFDVDRVLNSLDVDSLALQAAYIANNPNPLGEKDSLNAAPDHSTYSALHEKYHPHIRHFLQKFEYYDIFLVDPDTGDVIYSVFKELDYTTSLVDGPYAKTGLGEAFRLANAGTEANHIAITDFAPYTPSYEDPASFIASPIFDNGKKIGVLVFQMPIDRINAIMTYDQDWQNRGLGASGETYLVGSDFTMRSLGRFIVDDKPAYLNVLRTAGVQENIRQLIDLKDTTIGLQEVHSPGAEKALSGVTGTGIFNDYREIPVVSAYAPLEIAGLNWAILSEVDEAEAFAAVSALIASIFKWSLLGLLSVGLLSCVVGHLFAKSILNPIYYVVDAIESIARNIESGKCDLTTSLRPGTNPIGARLSNACNQMIAAFAEMIRQVVESSHRVSSSADQLSEAATRSLNGIVEQRDQAEHAVSAMQDMQRSVDTVSESVHRGNAIAHEVDSDTRRSTEVVNESVRQIRALARNVDQAAHVITRLEQDSMSIGSVMDVIRGIAEQTNLLALNAAIEAARAGEQGRGFAVVADEVRSLASRTQDSTAEIQTIIESLQERSKEAVGAMLEGREQAKVGVESSQLAGETLAQIEQKVGELENVSNQIAQAVEAQLGVSDSISRAIVNINRISEQNENAAMSSSAEIDAVQSLANNLQSTVAGYKV